MDVQQLKLLAERVRELVQQSNHPLGYNQSLDLIAALPGLRNWPEVQAFPDRVAGCELDATSAGRLAFRLKKKFSLDLSTQDLLAVLNPPSASKSAYAPQVWPTGPKPGVYVTTSQEAINALLERYEEATDGGVVYAERAGSHWEGSIDLGEDGLWSSGLSRVPSGTLLIVGPVELNQQSWESGSKRLEMACLNAQISAHRVAVLVRTPNPEAVFEDVLLMVRDIQPEDDDCHTALLGMVTEDGELLERSPFARPRPLPMSGQTIATPDAIPLAARSLLQEAVTARQSGLLLFGTEIFDEHPAIELVAASLALTEHAGPAARIMPRRRSTPAKDWLVPEAIKQLPFLPSIESAYEQGYRRMIVSQGYTSAEVLMRFGQDVLFISGEYGGEVGEVFMSALRTGAGRNADLLSLVIAILAANPVPMRRGEAVVSDLFLMPQVENPIPQKGFSERLDFLHANRTLKWEDEVSALLDSGSITTAGLKKALPNSRYLTEFLSQGAARKKTAPAAS